MAHAAEEAKPVALTGWKIGLSSSIFLTAPANLAAGGVDWALANNAFGVNSWSAQNDDVRVELARALSSRFDELKKAAITVIGGADGAGHASNLDSYSGWSYEAGGKFAGAWKQSGWAWAVVVTPGKTATAANVTKDILKSLWLERVEAPVWKDRTLGMTWQAETPHEMVLANNDADGSEYYRARWDNFSIETMKCGPKTDFDGTIKLQTESFSKQPGITDIKVQQFPRQFGFVVKERGVAVQIDFKRGDRSYRLYKIGSVTGYGAVIVTLNLDPKNPVDLATAARILHTLRLGYGVGDDEFREVKLEKDSMAFDSRADYRTPTQNGELRAYIGQDVRNFVFSVANPSITPEASNVQDLGTFARDTVLGNFLQGIGGKLEKTTIQPAAVGAFPARRLRFEATIQKQQFYGDALAIMGSSNLVFPVFLTTTATNDFMPRVASTLRFGYPAPAGWKAARLGNDSFQAIFPEGVSGKAEDKTWKAEAVKDGVKFIVQEKQQNYIDDPFLSFDGLTTGEKEDNPIENEYGALLEVKLRFGMRAPQGFHWARTSVGESEGIVGWGPSEVAGYKMRDVIALRTGTHTWVGEIHWNPAGKTSSSTREAIWASLRCDRFELPGVSAPATPDPAAAPHTTDTDAMDWLF